MTKTIKWRHNKRDGVSNHRRLDCLLNRFFRRRSRKTSKFHVTGLCAGNSPVTGNSRHKGPVTRKMFPFDDVTWQMHPTSGAILTIFFKVTLEIMLSFYKAFMNQYEACFIVSFSVLYGHAEITIQCEVMSLRSNIKLHFLLISRFVGKYNPDVSSQLIERLLRFFFISYWHFSVLILNLVIYSCKSYPVLGADSI